MAYYGYPYRCPSGIDTKLSPRPDAQYHRLLSAPPVPLYLAGTNFFLPTGAGGGNPPTKIQTPIKMLF